VLSHIQRGSATHGPAAEYLRPHVRVQAKAPVVLVYMHVESVRHLVGSRVSQDWRHEEPNRKQSLEAWHCARDWIWLQSVKHAFSVGLNMQPWVALHDAFVEENLHRVLQLPDFALNWQTSEDAVQADWVVRFTQAVVQLPEIGLTWHRDPADLQASAFSPKAS
jgi:hypothetical protein